MRRPARLGSGALRLGLLQLVGRALPNGRPRPTEPLRRVLLLRPDHIGDVLLTAPAIDLIRASLPDAELTYLVGPWSAAAARHGAVVDHLRTLPFPGFTRRPKANLLAPYALLVREAARLRAERFGLAIVFRPDHWWGALLARAAGIPVRVGGDTPETAPLISHSLPVRADRHAAERALDMARLAIQAVARPPRAPDGQGAVFRITPEAHAAAAELWRMRGLDGRRVAAIQPGAGMPLKSWPIDRWARLADALAERGLAVLLVGAPADTAVLASIRGRLAEPEVVVACGQSLEVSAALYARCAVLIGPDSGAAHLAAAVGTPTIRLYGPAEPRVFGPWPPRSDQRVLVTDGLACVPCGHLEKPPCGATELPACMLALSVQDVLNALGTLPVLARAPA